MLAVSLLMTFEYARLVLFTGTAQYRVYVLLVWIGIFLLSTGRIIYAFAKTRSTERKSVIK